MYRVKARLQNGGTTTSESFTSIVDAVKYAKSVVAGRVEKKTMMGWVSVAMPVVLN